jgi:hypothetical protein
MKKNILTVMAAIATLCSGLHPAGAGLLGMPLNLKVVVELHEIVAPGPACQFYTDDVLTGPLMVRTCCH